MSKFLIRIRVEKAVELIRHELKLDNLDIAVDPFSKTEKKGAHKGCMYLVSLSNRGAEDMNSYSLRYNPSKVYRRSDEEIISDVVHEMTHVLMTPAFITFERALTQISTARTRKVLDGEWFQTREQVAYAFEAALGKHLYQKLLDAGKIPLYIGGQKGATNGYSENRKEAGSTSGGPEKHSGSHPEGLQETGSWNPEEDASGHPSGSG